MFFKLLSFHLAVRTLTNEYPTPISLAEEVILGLIHNQNTTTQKEISTILQLEKSTISRTIKNLIQKKLVKKIINQNDARSWQLTLSQRGSNILQKDDKIRSKVSSQLLAKLSPAEQEVIRNWFEKLADSLNVPADCLRTYEHPLRLQQRRLTRAFKLLGTQLKFSKLSITSIHILKLVETKQLEWAREIQPYDQSTISRTLTSLAQKGYVLYLTNPSDKRLKQASLTKNASKLLRDLNKNFKKHCNQFFSSQELASVGRCLDKLISYQATPNYTPIEDNLEFQIVNNKEQLARIRGHYIETLVHKNQASLVEANLYLPSSTNIAAWHNSKLYFAVELVKLEDTLLARNIYCIETPLEENSCLALLTQICEKLLPKNVAIKLSTKNPLVKLRQQNLSS